MGKYSSYSRPKPKPRNVGVHPVMRGIGCIMMVVVPILSYGIAALLVNYGATHGWPIPAEWFGPLSVHPDHQGRGIGSALVNELLDRAGRGGETLVALLGDPDYYERFGFRESTWFSIDPPEEWGRHFQVLTLPSHDPLMRGRFRYAEPFNRL